MNTKTYILILLIGFIYISCKKENTNSSNATTTSSPCIVISGYTSTNETGDWTGLMDTTDWRLDDNWSTCEKDLFGSGNYNSNCVFSDTLLTNPIAYPNPIHDILSFSIGFHFIGIDTNLLHAINHNDSAIAVDLLILNDRLQPLSSIHTNKYQFDHLHVSLNSIDPTMTDTLFRVYYKLSDGNGCVRTGHGDIVRY